MNCLHKINLVVGKKVTITEVIKEKNFFRINKTNQVPDQYIGTIINETKKDDNYRIEIDINKNNLGGGNILEFIYVGKHKWQYLYIDPLKNTEKINNQNLGYYIEVKQTDEAESTI